MTEIALVFLVNAITSVVKRWIFPKYGKFGVQVIAFALATIGAVYYTYHNEIPGLQNVVAAAISLFSLAVAFYEVILQYIPLFKGPAIEKESE